MVQTGIALMFQLAKDAVENETVDKLDQQLVPEEAGSLAPLSRTAAKWSKQALHSCFRWQNMQGEQSRQV